MNYEFLKRTMQLFLNDFLNILIILTKNKFYAKKINKKKLDL